MNACRPFEPVKAPAIGYEISVRQQRDMLGWRLPMPFTMPDLASAIAERVRPGVEKRSATLAEATLRAWIKTGRITHAGQIEGLPSYVRAV